MTVYVKIKGLQALNRNLNAKQNKIIKKLSRAIHSAGLFMEGEIKESISGHRAEKMSVDTGNFMRSIFTDNSRDFSSLVGTPVHYAKYLEFGTSRMAPRSHFRNSLIRNERKITEYVAKQLD